MFPDPVPPQPREDDCAPLAPGRRVLRPVRRGRHAQHGRGRASARAVRRASRSPHRPRRGDQATGARGRPGHARSGEPARSHVHHAARSRGHPPARVRSGRRDGRDRWHRPPLSDLSPGSRTPRRETAHRGDPADGGCARRGRRPPQEGRRRDEVLRRGEKTRGRRRRDLPRGARSHVRDRAGRPRDHQVEGDLRQPRNDARPGRRRRQRARVHHHQARLMVHSAWFVLAIVLVALAFDFINGFHDAANSIATVVSTRVLTPSAAVVWAAAFNFIAAFLFGTAVVKTMGKGLVDLAVVDATVILAGLIGAIVWDLITWWLGLPTSSSHALIGGYGGSGVRPRERAVGPPWGLSPGGAAMGLGTMSGCWRIVKTMGQRVTKLPPFGGFCAETSRAITLFIASHFGIPVSTTHTITGAISGVGAAQRLSAVRWGVAGQIVWAWILTIPAAAGIGGLSYLLLHALLH